jgi:type VI secretion system secreted protein Hcp
MQWSFGVTLGVGASLAFAAPAFAAIDAYLKIDGVQGESRREPGAIELKDWSFGAGRGIGSPTGAASDRGAGAPNVRQIMIIKTPDKTSPLLHKCAATGCHFSRAELVVRKAGERPGEFLRYQLSDVMISSYQLGGSGERASESLTLNFTRIEVQGQPQTQTAGGQNPMTPGTTQLPPPGRGR